MQELKNKAKKKLCIDTIAVSTKNLRQVQISMTWTWSVFFFFFFENLVNVRT